MRAIFSSMVCKRLRLRAAVIFNGCADHAAGVGDKVGEHQDTFAVQKFFGFRRERNVCALGNELGFQVVRRCLCG